MDNFNPTLLKWSDIKSPLLPGKEYLEHITNPEEKKKFMDSYNSYIPDPKLIQEIKDILEKMDATISLLILGASWCSGCARIDPQFMKIEEAVNSPKFTVRFLAGLKKRYPHTEGKSKYIRPKDAAELKYDLTETPTIYFYKDGIGFARIERDDLKIENHGTELLSILKKME